MVRNTYPISAFFLLTEACNLHCSYCFHEQEPDRLTHARLSLDQFIFCVNALSHLNIRHYIFSGGEPLLYPELLPALSYVHSKGYELLLLSNAHSLTQQNATELFQVGVRSMSISLNKLVTCTEQTVVEQLIKEYCDKIKVLRNAGIEWITVILVISSGNYRFLSLMLEAFMQMRVGVLLQPVYCSSVTGATDYLSLRHLSPQEWVVLEKSVLPWVELYRVVSYWRFVRSLYGVDQCKPTQCHMGSTALVVRPDASVLPCFHRDDLACGSLLSDSPESIHTHLKKAGLQTQSATCFGEHCVSLFMEY